MGRWFKLLGHGLHNPKEQSDGNVNVLIVSNLQVDLAMNQIGTKMG